MATTPSEVEGKALHIFLANKEVKQVIDLQANDDRWEPLEEIFPLVHSSRNVGEQEFCHFYSETMETGKPNERSIVTSRGWKWADGVGKKLVGVIPIRCGYSVLRTPELAMIK